ncbi:MAG: DNA-3-methyladenine glycosylase [Kastovskya adunca ATA6-11-RM4]|jgi:DNA-3-methyladenine glycosylase|nr:DNA-3-methyladenine glycosylase [Kastovskya adunca ATA6-11-RM4]
MGNCTQSTQIVEPSWLARPSTVVAPDLLGCTIVRQLADGKLLRGMIVETEAYAPGDPACHAYRRQTPRNEVMFGSAGQVYVYLIYGMYHCLNIVTDRDQVPSAVLIRALQIQCIPPELDPGTSFKRDRLAAGPGKLCKVLQIDRSLNATPLKLGEPLWLEHRSPHLIPEVVQTTRIGLTKGVDLPWRWYLKDCPAVSKL